MGESYESPVMKGTTVVANFQCAVQYSELHLIARTKRAKNMMIFLATYFWKCPYLQYFQDIGTIIRKSFF